MQSFNDAQKLLRAKGGYGNVLFRNKTALRASWPLVLCVLFTALAAALPAALLVQKREKSTPVPYLEIRVTGPAAPGPA